MFNVDDKGEENTIQLALPNWWITDYMSINNKSQSQYFIQSVAGAEVLAIGIEQLDELTASIVPFGQYMQIMMRKSLAAHQYRLQLIHSQSKEQIIVEFYTLFGSFAKQIPQYIVASYLAVSSEYLSKVLKNNPSL